MKFTHDELYIKEEKPVMAVLLVLLLSTLLAVIVTVYIISFLFAGVEGQVTL